MSYFDASFYDKIAQGRYSTIQPWAKIGYSPTVNSTESDVWSKAGLVGNSGLLPSAAATMKVVSSSANDRGAGIFSGTTTGGSTTTLIDSGTDFTSGTAAAVGDIIMLDRTTLSSGEWGYVTGITGTHQLDVAGGFSSGGSGAGARSYDVIDASAYTGGNVLFIDYLDSAYNEHTAIIRTLGVSANTTTHSMLRINGFRVVGTGSGLKADGNISLQDNTSTYTYSYITAGFTRARNSCYTVPAGKTLYINEWNVGWATPNDTKVQTTRMYIRMNREPTTQLLTGNVFYPIAEAQITNGHESVQCPIAVRVPEKTDIRVCGLAASPGSGPCTSVMRGYLVTN